MKEYQCFLSAFLKAFTILIALGAEIKLAQFFTTIAFLIRGSTNIIAGYICKTIATLTTMTELPMSTLMIFTRSKSLTS